MIIFSYFNVEQLYNEWWPCNLIESVWTFSSLKESKYPLPFNIVNCVYVYKNALVNNVNIDDEASSVNIFLI